MTTRSQSGAGGFLRRYRAVLALAVIVGGVAVSQPRQAKARTTIDLEQCIAAAVEWGEDCRADAGWLKRAACRIGEGAIEVACLAVAVGEIIT